MSEFIPLRTSMDSFKAAETSLYEHFRGAGRSHEQATRIANVFTQFMLGYVTELGAISYIVDAGIADVEARAIVKSYAREKQRIIDRAALSGRASSDRERVSADG